jgi:hypothetical protein
MFKPIDLGGHGLNQPRAEALSHLVEVGGRLVYFFLRNSLRLALKCQTFRHQGFKGFAALSSGLCLCLRHGAQTRKPNVFGGCTVLGIAWIGCAFGGFFRCTGGHGNSELQG